MYYIMLLLYWTTELKIKNRKILDYRAGNFKQENISLQSWKLKTGKYCTTELEI